MAVHPGRLALVVLALAEIGALVGALVCAVFLLSWAVLVAGTPPLHVLGQVLAGTLVWAGMVGAPVGAVALPLLGLTVLRRVPLGRALALPFVGALAGVLVAALLLPAGAVWPVPALVPALGFSGLFAGAVAARVDVPRLVRSRTTGRRRS
jgi:uncharacterized membrane protein